MVKHSSCLGVISLFLKSILVFLLYGITFRVILISRTALYFEFRGIKISRIFANLAKFRELSHAKFQSRENLSPRKLSSLR